jgi:hypothetical protein
MWEGLRPGCGSSVAIAQVAEAAQRMYGCLAPFEIGCWIDSTALVLGPQCVLSTSGRKSSIMWWWAARGGCECAVLKVCVRDDADAGGCKLCPSHM